MFTSAGKTVCCIAYVIVGFAVAAPPASTDLPNGIVRCSLRDPALSKCIKEQLLRAYPLLVTGIPSLGIHPIDPMRITKLEVNQGIGAVNVKIKLQDLDIKNLHATVITDFDYDPKNHTIKFGLLSKKPLVLEGHYETNGKVLILPIVGNGTCKYTLDNYKSVSTVHMVPKLKNGKTYMKIDNFSWKFTTTKLHIRLDNLFNGDKILGENMNVFLNENWRELLEEMQPTFEEALGVAFISLGQEFFNRVSYNEIFLD